MMKRAIVFLLLSSYLWSLAYIFIGYLGKFLNPLFLSFIRAFFSMMILIFLVRKTLNLKIFKYSYIPLVDSLAQLLFVLTIIYLGPILSAFLSRPLLSFTTFLFSLMIFKDERKILLNFRTILGCFLIIVGSLIVMFPKGKLSVPLIGVFLLLFLTLLRSLSSSLVKLQLKEFDEKESLLFYFLMSSLYFLPLSLITIKTNTITPFILFIAFLSSLFPMVIGGLLYYKAIREVGAGIPGIMTSFIPIFTLVNGILFGFKIPEPFQIFGCSLSIFGVFLLSRIK